MGSAFAIIRSTKSEANQKMLPVIMESFVIPENISAAEMVADSMTNSLSPPRIRLLLIKERWIGADLRAIGYPPITIRALLPMTLATMSFAPIMKDKTRTR